MSNEQIPNELVNQSAVVAGPPADPLVAPDDERVIAAVRHFRVVIRAIQAHSAWVERQFGVSAPQLWALWEIERDPGLKVSDIARRLSIKPATASNMLDKIEKKGLLRRERRGPDQRVVQLFITSDGNRLLAKAPGPKEGALLNALTRLDVDQLAHLNGGLESLIEKLAISDESVAFSPLHPES